MSPDTPCNPSADLWLSFGHDNAGANLCVRGAMHGSTVTGAQMAEAEGRAAAAAVDAERAAAELAEVRAAADAAAASHAQAQASASEKAARLARIEGMQAGLAASTPVLSLAPKQTCQSVCSRTMANKQCLG